MYGAGLFTQFLMKGVYLERECERYGCARQNLAQHKMEAPDNDKYRQKSISKNAGTTE
jgi:hypothetical protein